MGSALVGAGASLWVWSSPAYEASVEAALLAHDKEAVARRSTVRDATLNEAALSTVATERRESWKDVPIWRPLKRWNAFRAAKQADPFFQSQSLAAQVAQFVQDVSWDVGQPVWDKMHEPLKEIDDEAYILPKQAQRGRLTVVIDYRCFLQFYYDKQVGVIARKRPGTDVFLERLVHHVDLVLVCDRARSEVEQFLWKVDPMARFSSRIYRQALIEKGRVLWKPMHKLGRNPARVLVIDQKLAVSEEYADNVVVLKPWGGFGFENTPDLLALLPFVLQMAKANEDVRDHIRKYNRDEIYIPSFYHKTMLLAHQYDKKKMDPVSTNIVQLNPTPDFFDAGTLPEVDPWDDEPESLLMDAQGGHRRGRLTRNPEDVYSLSYKLWNAGHSEDDLRRSDGEVAEFVKKFPASSTGPVASSRELMREK